MRKHELSIGTALSFVSQFVNIVSGIVFTPIVIRLLGQSEYGLYQLVLSLANNLSLLSLGLNVAYIRYYSIAKKESEEAVGNINGMFFTILSVASFFCLLIGLFLCNHIEILGNSMTTAEYRTARLLMICMVINMACTFPNSLLIAYIYANEHFIFTKTLSIILNLLLPIAKIPILLLGCGSLGVAVITLVFTVLQLMINFIYCICKLQMKIHCLFFDKSIFADLAKYTFFVFLATLIDQMNANVDKILLGSMMGTIAVAVYSVAFNLNHFFNIMTWIVPEMYVPMVNRAVLSVDGDATTNFLFQKIGKINNYFTLLVISGFLLFGKSFINLWVGDGYQGAYAATLLLMLASYIPAVQTLGTNIQNAKNMHQSRSVVYLIIAFLNVLVSIFLIKRVGLIGACIGTLCACLLGQGLFMNYFYHKRIGLDIIAFWRIISRWYPYVLILAGLAMVVLRMVSIRSWKTLMLGILVYTTIYGLVLFICELNKEERNAIINILQKHRK